MATWTQLRKTLERMDAPELLGVIERLYTLGADNKRALAALLQGDLGALRERADKEIERAFAPRRGLPTFKTGPARQAVKNYAQFAPPQQVLDLELHFVEQGISCTAAYGDLDGAVYNSVTSVWQAALRRAADLPERDVPWSRLERTVANAQGYGWGFSDEMQALYDAFLKETST